MNPLPPSVFTLPQTAQLEALYTIIRSKETSRGDFLFYSDRIIRLLVEEGLNHLPVVKKVVQTPTGATYEGVGFKGKICGVSILRAGEVCFLEQVTVCRGLISAVGDGGRAARSLSQCADRKDSDPEGAHLHAGDIPLNSMHAGRGDSAAKTVLLEGFYPVLLVGFT
jgi:hypothetical protein